MAVAAGTGSDPSLRAFVTSFFAFTSSASARARLASAFISGTSASIRLTVAQGSQSIRLVAFHDTMLAHRMMDRLGPRCSRYGDESQRGECDG